jgi:NTP pyrophosphatase (non-canonical NTP hydrolase)
MSEIQELQDLIRKFADARNWHEFHTPKNLAMAVTGEAGELASEFQWLTADESMNLSKKQLDAVSMEMADIAIYLLRMADVLGVELRKVIEEKISINENRFPVQK